MPNATPRANARTLPENEPRFRITHLIRDQALKKAMSAAEGDLSSLPVLPKDKNGASGSDDARSIFWQALKQAELAAARYMLVEAEFFAAGGVNLRGKELAKYQAIRNTACALKREETLRFAAAPAMTQEQLAQKKRLIGPGWLHLYSEFREAVARDEAYLKTKAAAQREGSNVQDGEART